MTIREVSGYLLIKARKVYDLVRREEIPCAPENWAVMASVRWGRWSGTGCWHRYAASYAQGRRGRGRQRFHVRAGACILGPVDYRALIFPQ